MLRNVALTFLAITARALVPVLVLVQRPFTDTDALAAGIPSLISIGQVLGWVVNLAVIEVLIRRRRVSGPTATSGACQDRARDVKAP